MKRMLFPLIKKYWKMLLAVLLISAVGCGYAIGLYGSYLSLERSLQDYVEDYRYPHAVITTEVTDRSHLQALANIPGVQAVSARLCGDTVMKNSQGRYLSVRAFSYNDDDPERFHFWSTAEGGGADRVYVEYDFAVNNGLSAGDTVSFKLGDEWRDYFVAGLVSLPETLAVQPTGSGSWTTNADFGYVYASVHLLEAEYNKIYDEASDELDEKQEELDDARREMDDELADVRQKLDEAARKLDEQTSLLNDARKEANEKRDELLRNRAGLLYTRSQLVTRRDQLLQDRSAAQSALEQLVGQQSRLAEAQNGLTTLNEKLAELDGKLALLLSEDVVWAVGLLRYLPEGTDLAPISTAMNTFQRLITSAQAYGFYYEMNERVDTVAQRLSQFLDGVRQDAAYLASEEALSVLARVESGEEGIADTPEYAAVTAVVSRYAPVFQPDELPPAYAFAQMATAELQDMAAAVNLDEIVARLTLFDAAETVSSLSNRMDRLRNGVGELSGATGESFHNVGEVVRAYDSAVQQLKDGRAALESAQAQILEALAAQGLSEEDVAPVLAGLAEKIQALRSALAQIEDGLAQIDDGIWQIDAGLLKIDQALAEIEEQLAEAEAALQEAREELESGESEYEQSFTDMMLEFASMEDELATAREKLEEGQDYGDLCNQFLLWFDEDTDGEAALEAARNSLGDVAVKNDYSYERSPVKTRIDLNLKPIQTMSTFIPAVFFTVLMVIVFLFMSLIVRQSRREIGILRALGFSAGKVRLLFCGVNLATALAACLLGLGIGLFLTWYVTRTYAGFFYLPAFRLQMDWPRVLLCFLLNIAVGQAATFISSGFVTRVSPAEAMSRPIPPAGGAPGFLGRLTRRVSPMTAFSLTTLLRNPVRFAFSVLCVSASIMMIFAALAFLTSKDNLIRQTYEQRIRYDCQVFFTGPVREETLSQIQALDYVKNVQTMPQYQKELSFNGRTESVTLSAPEQYSQLIGVYDRDGRRLPLNLSEDGILLEQHTADALGAGPGDTVLLDGKIPLHVEGISFQSIARSQYLAPGGAGVPEEDTLGTVICRIAPENEQKLMSVLVEQEDYLYTVFTRASHAGLMRMLAAYDFAAWIIIVFAVGTGFIIVLNTTRTNLLEKKKELCILRTLGCQHGEISRSLFSHSLLHFIFSCMLGFPLGRLVAEAALARFSTASQDYVYANTLREVALTALCVLGYIVLSHCAAMGELRRWDIVESVKEKE